jgi:hypothetical protein
MGRKVIGSSGQLQPTPFPPPDASLGDDREAVKDARHVDVWACFHRAWSTCVGTADYDKEVWKAAERQLLTACKVLGVPLRAGAGGRPGEGAS